MSTRFGFHSAGAPQFHQLAAKTFAAHPVWRGSSTAEIRFQPLSKKDAVRIFHDARRYERQTRGRYVTAAGIVSRQDGAIGRCGLAVLHALLFDFLNYRSGRLDPCYASIAEKAAVSIRSVARALVKLKAAGVVNWVRRCSGRVVDGRFLLEQDSNAYGVAPASLWRGYRPPPPAPPPDPSAWGAAPALPSPLALAAQETAAGASRAALAHLESDPGDKLAGALALLARRRTI